VIQEGSPRRRRHRHYLSSRFVQPCSEWVGEGQRMRPAVVRADINRDVTKVSEPIPTKPGLTKSPVGWMSCEGRF
jgi:hypothetical protein